MSKSQPYNPDTYIQPTTAEPSALQKKGPPARETAPNIDNFITVDPKVYTSKEIHDQEFDKLWTRAWLMAGMESDAAQPGEWFKFDVGHDSFIIVRGKDMELRALYNVCQHRGNRLVTEAFGRKPNFVCPYHSWMYDLTGENIRVTDEETFRPEALCGNLGLPSIRCETHGGLVFVNVDEDAPDLLTYLGGAADVISSYNLGEMNIVRDVLADAKANWKVGVHAFLESYHVHITHPGAFSAADEKYVQLDWYGHGNSRALYELGDASTRVQESQNISEVQRRFMEDAGVDMENYNDGNLGVRKAIQKVKRSPNNRFGFDYSNFTDEQLTDDWCLSLFPNTQFSLHPEGTMLTQWWPDPEDPARHIFRMTTLCAKLADGANAPWYMGVPPGTDISGRVRPPQMKVNADIEGVGPLVVEDLENLQESQHGMLSRGLKQVRFSQQEQKIQYFFAEWDRFMSS